MLKEKYREWNKTFENKKIYSSNFPFCFYDLAGKYLPNDKNAVIIDIGCGNCRFENYFNLWDRYENLRVLDGNAITLKELRQKNSNINTLNYIAPDKIPFDNESIDYIFCGHLIEHLDFKELYKLFKEFDRVLKVNGILVINSPMIWFGFYGVLDHVKPYHPKIFRDYFYGDENPSYPPISRNYKLEELVYRYHSFVDIHNTTGSSVKIIDFLIQVSKYILRVLGIKKYTQTGYTIILRKKE